MFKKIKSHFSQSKSSKNRIPVEHFASLAPGVFWKDLNGVYQGYNKELLKFLGLKSAKDIIGKTDYELPWTLDQAETLVKNDQHVIATCRAARFEETVRDFAGNEKVFMVIKVPMRDTEGNLIGMVGTASDITEIKAAEEKRVQELKAMEAEKNTCKAIFNTIIDSIPGMHWWKDIGGVYQGCNHRMVNVLGLRSKNDIIGKTDHQLPWYKSAPQLMQSEQEAKTTGCVHSQEAEAVRMPDGVLRTFRITCTPLRDPKGNLVGTVGSAIEVTAPVVA